MQKISALTMKAIKGGATDDLGTCSLVIEYRHSNHTAFTKEVRIGLTQLPEITLSRAVPVPAGTETVDGGIVLSCTCS